MVHTGDIKSKLGEAKKTLFLADAYMESLGKEFEVLQRQEMTEKKVREYISQLLPADENATDQQKKNIERLREDLTARYFDAPDLKGLGNNAYRFINAISDFATHAEPLRKTANYKESLFARTVDGNPLIDRAYQMVQAA